MAVRREKETTVFPLLDDHLSAAEFVDFAGRLGEIRFSGEFASLGIVQKDGVNALDELVQSFAFISNPKVHGVAADEDRLCDLVKDFDLQAWMDITEEDEFRVSICMGQLRMEMLENIEVSCQCLSLIQIVPVLSGPSEGLALLHLEPFHIDTAAAQGLEVFLREVISDHRHHAGLIEISSRKREVCGGTSEGFFALSKGSKHGIKGDRADNKNRHDNILLRLGNGKKERACENRRVS